MKAIVHPEYGLSDVLRLEHLETPILGEGEVLVRVHAASVNVGAWRIMRVDPSFIRLMLGGLFEWTWRGVWRSSVTV